MKKILIVAMADSVHTARWLRQFDDEQIDFLLFPSTPHRRVHQLIVDLLKLDSKSNFKIARFMRFGGLPIGIFDLIFSNQIRSRLLAREIECFQPDLIHIMETQHSGYLTDRALDLVALKPKVALSIWGSDLYWFQRFQKHRSRISSMLKKVDFMITECQRDEAIAKNIGFAGRVIYGVPASGGFNEQFSSSTAQELVPSSRKIIAIKGYSGFVGLGLLALKAIGKLSSKLRDYSIVVYSADWRTFFVAQVLKFRSKLQIEIRIKHSQTPEQMKDLFLRSRVVVGMSRSDGLPATIKEAAFFGAFPIQTDTSCAGEWFEDGVSILLVPADSSEALERALTIAISDDNLVDSAARLNSEIAKIRMNSAAVRSKIAPLYD